MSRCCFIISSIVTIALLQGFRKAFWHLEFDINMVCPVLSYPYLRESRFYFVKVRDFEQNLPEPGGRTHRLLVKANTLDQLHGSILPLWEEGAPAFHLLIESVLSKSGQSQAFAWLPSVAAARTPYCCFSAAWRYRQKYRLKRKRAVYRGGHLSWWRKRPNVQEKRIP